MKLYCVYILLCNDGSYYTGVTSDLEDRMAKHHAGANPRSYTYSRRPVKLVYKEIFQWVYHAIEREKQIKGWSRAKKAALIQNDIERLIDLSKASERQKGDAESGVF